MRMQVSHHFDADVAFDEIRRVLLPGRALALFWARSGDEEPAIVSITREIDRLVERVRGSSEIVDAYRAWYDPPEAIDGSTTATAMRSARNASQPSVMCA